MKFKNAFGLLLHILVVLGCFAAFSWPYLGQRDLWFFLVFVSITHYVQDWAKIKFTNNSKHSLFFFMLDQILHFSFISLIYFTNLKSAEPPLNLSKNLFLDLYNSNAVVLYLIIIIIASYMAHYVILIIKKDYLKLETNVSLFEKRYGFSERIIIVSLAIAGKLWLLLIPVVLALRPILFKAFKDKLTVSAQFASTVEILLSAAASLLTGLTFYLLI